MAKNGIAVDSKIVKACLFTWWVFLNTKLTELNKLKKLTKNVVAVSGMMLSRVKLDTTIRPKPKPLSV